jgi:hypothetical protein
LEPLELGAKLTYAALHDQVEPIILQALLERTKGVSWREFVVAHNCTGT